MLGKLLKHEFRATSRIMPPLYLVLLALSVCANLSIRMLDSTDVTLLNILGGIIVAAFGFAIIGVCIMSVILMINRFRTNLMSDEGYLMFTLPVSVHQLVWSKIIVSTVWFIVTFFATVLSGIIVSFRAEYVTKLISLTRELFQQITAYYAINGAAFLLEILVMTLVCCAAVCLLFYASIAVGHSFANRKSLLSFVFFFVFLFATLILSSFMTISLVNLDLNWSFESAAVIHAFMAIGIFCYFIYGAIFYFVTTFMLKRHLNLT